MCGQSQLQAACDACPELSIVLPCYNEAKGLEALVRRFAEAGAGYDFELILVDNGSKDRTPEVLAGLLTRFRFARSIRVEVNQGYGHGIFTGLRQARGQIVSWSHADLQTDPGDVFRALEVLKGSGLPAQTLVKGHRYGRRASERFISWGMQVVATVLLRSRLKEINAQPKLFGRELLSALTHAPIDFNFDVYVLHEARRQGWQVRSIPVAFPPRQYGQSNWAATWRSKLRTILRSVKYMLRLGVLGAECDNSMRAADERAFCQASTAEEASRAA